jgi:hypothetical protein
MNRNIMRVECDGCGTSWLCKEEDLSNRPEFINVDKTGDTHTKWCKRCQDKAEVAK